MKRSLCGTVLAGLLLCVTAASLDDADQGQPQFPFSDDFTPCNTTAVNGSIVLQPSLNVTRCNLTVEAPKGTKFTTIQFSRLSLQGGDNLTIYDGKQQLINVTGQRDSLAVVVFSSKACLVVNINTKNSKSVLQATYNSSVCSFQQAVVGTAGMTVQSPVYLPNKGAFNCSYTISQAPPPPPSSSSSSSTGLALTFLTVALPKATLNVTSSSSPGVVVNGSGLFPDVYGSKIQMVLTVPKVKSTMQNFSAIASPITMSPVCGKVKDVATNQTFTLNITAPQQNPLLSPIPYECRVTLRVAPAAAAKGASSLLLNISSLVLGQRGDRVEVIDGGSLIGSNVLASFDSSSAAGGYLVLSGQKQVLVRLVLGLMPGPRSLVASVKALSASGHLYKSGNVSFASSNATQYYVMEAPAMSVVKFMLPRQTLNKTFRVSVYDGDQLTSPLLVTFSSPQQLGLPVVSSGRRLLVTVQLTNSSKALKASFTSQAPGCDQVTSAAQGSFQLMPAAKLPMCRWTVTAQPNSTGTILLDLTTLKLSQNATVSVYGGGGAWSGGSLVARFANVSSMSSAPLPSIAVAASQWAQVVFSSNNSRNVTKMAVNVRYQVVPSYCGGAVLGKRGHLRSPAFPNRYPLNSRCQWTFPPAKPGRLLFFDFPRFSLAPGHSLVVTEQRNGTSRQVASFNASSMPMSDVLYASNASNTLTFSTQSRKGKVALTNQVAQGFDVQYWALTCGGFMNKTNGSFSSPGFPALIPVTPANATLCVWMIQLSSMPGKDPKVVNMTLRFNKTGTLNVTDLVKVYDGSTIRHPLAALNISKKGDSAQLLSRFNATIVVLNITALRSSGLKANSPKLALSVNYTAWSCNKTFQCRNGQCMHPDWRCNGLDDCGDNTDEQNCVGPPIPVHPSKAGSKGMKPAIVVVLFFVGLVLGVVLTLVIPRIIRRFRTNRYATFRNEPAVA